jgi:Uri superfamily endonuclease
MDKKIGSYLLVLELNHDKKIKIGSQGIINFKKGHYIYVGSALNGLDQRIQRHIRKQKKLHWHIDYFLEWANVKCVYYKEGNKKEECTIARTLEDNLSSIVAFGSSDCKCQSHLFFGSCGEISKSISNFNINQYL